MKIRLVEAELFHEDGRTDGQTERHDEANSRFSQFLEQTYKLGTGEAPGLHVRADRRCPEADNAVRPYWGVIRSLRNCCYRNVNL